MSDFSNFIVFYIFVPSSWCCTAIEEHINIGFVKPNGNLLSKTQSDRNPVNWAAWSECECPLWASRPNLQRFLMFSVTWERNWAKQRDNDLMKDERSWGQTERKRGNSNWNVSVLCLKLSCSLSGCLAERKLQLCNIRCFRGHNCLSLCFCEYELFSNTPFIICCTVKCLNVILMSLHHRSDVTSSHESLQLSSEGYRVFWSYAAMTTERDELNCLLYLQSLLFPSLKSRRGES